MSAATAAFVGVQVILHPLNLSPFDRTWAGLSIAASFGICILAFIAHGRVLFVATLLGVVGLVGWAAIGSRAVVPLVTLVWILAVAVGLGEIVLRYLAGPFRIGADVRLLLAGVLGLGVQSLLTLGIGSLGLLRPSMVYTVYSALAIPGLFLSGRLLGPRVAAALRRAPSRWRTSDLRLIALLLSVLGISLAGAIVWAFSPAITYDTLSYHLGVPAIYAQEHRIVEVPEQFRSYWAHNGEMLYTMALVLADQPLPALVHLAFGLLAAGLLFCTGRIIGGERVGLVTATLFCTVPFVACACGSAFVDMISCAYAATALYAAASWWLEKEDKWLAVIGLAAGLALGTKLNCVFFFIPLISAVLLVGARSRGDRLCRILAAVFRIGLPAMVAWGPWLVRDWVWTSNPVFPFYNAVFQSPKWPAQNTLFNFGEFGRGRDLWSWLLLPWNLTFHCEAFAEAAPGGLLGAAPLMALPWAGFIHKPQVRPWALSLFAVTVPAVAMWFIVGQYARYLLPVIPALALLAAMNIESVWLCANGPRWRKSLAIAGVLGCASVLTGSLLVQIACGWPIPERFPYRVSLGFERREQYLARVLPVFRTFQYLDMHLREGSKVLSVGNEFRLYTKARVFGVFGSREAGMDIALSSSLSEAARHIRSHGYEWLLIDRTQTDADPRLRHAPVLSQRFLREHTELTYAAQGVFLYRFRDSVPPGPEHKNLLQNAGFEEPIGPDAHQGWLMYGKPVLIRTPETVHTGRYAVRVDAANGLFQQVRISPDELYSLAHWSRADAPNQLTRLQVNWLDDNLGIVDVSIVVLPAHRNWSWNSTSFSAPKRATIAQVYASVHDHCQVYMDDFVFSRGPILPSESNSIR